LVLKNDIEVAQFQSNSPQHLPLSEGFWKALVKLPSVYDFAAYRTVLQRFGTHYLSEGSLGGSFRIVGKIDEATEKQMGENLYIISSLVICLNKRIMNLHTPDKFNMLCF